MIIAILGTPSPLTYLATNLLRAIAQVTQGDHHMIGVNSLADLREAWPEQSQRKPAILLSSDMPRPDFTQFLIEQKVPVILCMEKVEDITKYFVTHRDVNCMSAMRIATHSLSNLEFLATTSAPNVMKLVPSNTSLSNVIADLLTFAREPAEAEAVSRIVQYLGFAERGHISFRDFIKETRLISFAHFDVPLSLDPEEFDALGVMAKSYNAVAAGVALEEAFWPAYCFVQADTPGLPAHGEFELDGKARFLAHGPYFHLPAGLWLAEVMIEVAESFSENRVGFDVYAGSVLFACTTTLPESGSVACDMVFRVEEATTSIEIRVQLLTGSIEGKLRLRGVGLRRLAEDEEPSP